MDIALDGPNESVCYLVEYGWTNLGRGVCVGIIVRLVVYVMILKVVGVLT
jgi:hypothetical protein